MKKVIFLFLCALLQLALVLLSLNKGRSALFNAVLSDINYHDRSDGTDGSGSGDDTNHSALMNYNHSAATSSEDDGPSETFISTIPLLSKTTTPPHAPSTLHEKSWTWISAEASKKLQENDCAPPILNPFDPDMTRVFRKTSVNCNSPRQTYYFKAVDSKNEDNDHEIVMVKRVPKSMECCFILLLVPERGQNTAINEYERKLCEPIKRPRTKVPIDTHFVTINCWGNVTSLNNRILGYVNFSHQELLILFPRPSRSLLESKGRLVDQRNDKPRSRLNIIAIGFDHVSRMSFIRQMSHSFKYLRSGLKAIDLHGFNKIGDSTLDNTLGFLTGYDFRAVVKNGEWWNPKEKYFDKLPFIWKEFSELGYITSVANDFNSAFHYQLKGFKSSPTDYFLNGLTQYRLKRNRNANASQPCFGKLLELDLLQHYAVKTSLTLRKHPYFQFVWNSGTSHSAAHASMADNGLFSALKHFNSSGILNKSLVIVWSDHGWRRNEILSYSQARTESKMPFAFLLLPKWFKDVYPMAYANLHENQYRLTTVYDIHSTLVDMLNPEANLNDKAISKSKPLLNSWRRRLFGISLFRPIPETRTCEAVGVDEVWCSCSVYEDIIFGGEDKDAKWEYVVEKLASFAVDTINLWLEPYDQCKQYRLETVIKAEVKKTSKGSPSAIDLSRENTFKLLITVATQGESRPTFEVFVFTKPGWLRTKRDLDMERECMNMSSVVVRLTQYGVSSCMNVYNIQPVCSCV